jgi:hypothetical protein
MYNFYSPVKKDQDIEGTVIFLITRSFRCNADIHASSSILHSPAELAKHG